MIRCLVYEDVIKQLFNVYFAAECALQLWSYDKSASESDGLEIQNLNPTDSDFSWLRHMPNEQACWNTIFLNVRAKVMSWTSNSTGRKNNNNTSKSMTIGKQYATCSETQLLRIQSKTSSCSVLSSAHNPRTSARWGFSDRESGPVLPPEACPDNTCSTTRTGVLQFVQRLRHDRASDVRKKDWTPGRPEKKTPSAERSIGGLGSAHRRLGRHGVAWREPPGRSTVGRTPSRLTGPPHLSLCCLPTRHTVNATLTDQNTHFVLCEIVARLTWFLPWAPEFRRATRPPPPA